MAAGNYDPATPFVFEQVSSFPRLKKASHKYLQVKEGQAHVDFSQLDAGITNMLETVEFLTLPSQTLLDDYTNSLMLAFFEVFISNNQDYEPYLQSAYAIYLSEGQDFRTDLITEDSAEELRQAINKFAEERNIRSID